MSTVQTITPPAGPKIHNPARKVLTEAELAEGWRFLLPKEAYCVPAGLQFQGETSTKWTKSFYAAGEQLNSWDFQSYTYRTKAPLPGRKSKPKQP